jgi:diguanylate cyclase (GGDEF)-like protein
MMEPVNRRILEQVLAESAEPMVIVSVDHSEWPVALSNRAFAAIGGENPDGRPFADVIEQMVGRELALEISEAVRSKQETSFPVEQGGREFLLVLKPLALPGEAGASFYAAFWRGGSGNLSTAGAEVQHALLKAKRRIRDLSRDDPVTGLLNGRAFREVLDHDWAVAARERSAIAVVVFVLDDFGAYVDVFGRHASDSCLRRVGQAIRRCLRRASDVVGRLDGERLAVLSHAPDEHAVQDFAARISTAVRELGLHHPRSRAGRFVTVSFRVGLVQAAEESRSAGKFLDDLLAEFSD